jgi:hypothetical protein
LQDAPEHLVAPGFHLGDALVEVFQLVERRHLLVLVGGGSRRLGPRDQRDESRWLPGRRRDGGGRGRRDGLDGREDGSRGRRDGGHGLGEHPGDLDLGDAGGGSGQLRELGGAAHGRGEAGEVLLGLALRPDRGGEPGLVAPAERGLGLGGVAPELEDRLLEGAVRVGEDEEPVEEAVRGGGAALKRGARLGEEEELGERGVERVEVGEARGGGGGVGGPGADGAGGVLEVGEQRVGAGGREADGADVAPGGARRAEREGDGAAEAGSHCYDYELLLVGSRIFFFFLEDPLLGCLRTAVVGRGEEEGVYKAERGRARGHGRAQRVGVVAVGGHGRRIGGRIREGRGRVGGGKWRAGSGLERWGATRGG